MLRPPGWRMPKRWTSSDERRHSRRGDWSCGAVGPGAAASVPQGIELIALTRQGLDLADAKACASLVREQKPDWVLNAGAYTAVDKAESEPELAQAVNAGAPAAFAEALAETGGRLLQVSTDFVFAGNQGSPYRPDQPVQPLGVYGASKAAGEQAALALPGGQVLRTSWVYGPVGKNFCLTMLRLHALKAAAGEPLGGLLIRWAIPRYPYPGGGLLAGPGHRRFPR